MVDQRKYDEFLFTLSDGTEVFKGDVLYHPNRRKVGWYCTAEFKPEGDQVTVRSPNGAVPTVKIEDLRKNPPEQPRWCECCGRSF